ncbi:patatin-like phospholipase family protein [bacterium]|nr:patatin-like phospholipase family protein [bacterium]
MAESRPRVGIALSGGVAKVVAHVGILRAFEEAGIPIDAVSATSGGTIIGAFYCAGTTIAEMESLADELSWKKLTRVTIPRLGLLSNERLERFLVDRLPVKTFEELQKPLAVVTADLTTGRKAVYTTGPLAAPIRASCSIPQLFPPVSIDGHLVADGGLVEYLPIQTLEEFDCDVRIGINLGGVRNWHMRDPKNFFEVALRVIGFVSQRNARVSESFADHVVRPNLAEFGPYDLERAADLIRVGYEAGRQSVPAIQAILDARTKQLPDQGEWTRMVRWLKDNSPLQVFGRRTT